MVRQELAPVLRARGAAVMAVLNVTPDSFFDGGAYFGKGAEARVHELVEQGADIIDIGGESSRPGSSPVSAEEQLRRVEPAVRTAVAHERVLVSVDTTRPEVAERVLSLGAHLINDVSCLADPELARVTARHGAGLIIMHCRGPMSAMEGFSAYPEAGYDDVVADVQREWHAARERALSAGMASEDVLFDPGFGFCKSARQSLELLARLSELSSLAPFMVVGPSRKSFIGSLDGTGPAERLGGTIAACILAVQHGAHVLRVHDVQPVRQALGLMHALLPNKEPGHA
jgi:dihydropteroate synthase